MRLGADHYAVEPVFHGLFQNLGGAFAVLQRYCGQWMQAVDIFCASDLELVHEAAPSLAFLSWQLVSETVEPAADHLGVQGLLRHPLKAHVRVVEFR